MSVYISLVIVRAVIYTTIIKEETNAKISKVSATSLVCGV